MAFEASLGRTTRIGAGIEALSLAVSVETVATIVMVMGRAQKKEYMKPAKAGTAPCSVSHP